MPAKDIQYKGEKQFGKGRQETHEDPKAVHSGREEPL
jgi:hypothetical protein